MPQLDLEEGSLSKFDASPFLELAFLSEDGKLLLEGEEASQCSRLRPQLRYD